MNYLSVSEIYVSVQGEGPRVGIPTVFIRFGGCNLRCPGWPCDSPYAIFPEQYKSEWKKLSAEEVMAQVPDYVTNVCLTGGEPFLQDKDELRRLCSLLRRKGHTTIECFSNGTRAYPHWVFGRIHFIMDWKLPGSGEDPNNLTRLANLYQLTPTDAVKFVCKDANDFAAAVQLYDEYLRNWPTRPEVFAGVVWGELADSQLVEWILAGQLPWRLNVQVQNYVFDRSQRGI